MGLLQLLIGSDHQPADRLSYTRARVDRASDASMGKALWALGYVVSRSRLLHSAAANDLVQELVSSWKPATFTGRAYAILGAANYLRRFAGASEVRRMISRSAEELTNMCEADTWMDQWQGADWPAGAQAVIVAAHALGNDDMARIAKRMMGQLLETTSNGTVFMRRGDNPDEEELPVTAATFIEAFGAAYNNDRTEDTLQAMRAAADWFLGANRKGTALYDFETGGCHDALTASGLNHNQGTEATTLCLLAFLTLTGISASSAPTPPAKSE